MALPILFPSSPSNWLSWWYADGPPMFYTGRVDDPFDEKMDGDSKSFI